MSDAERDKRIKEQFDRHVLDSRVATVGRIRELLLSDEFIDALVERMNEKLFVTEVRSVTFGTVDISNADNNSGVAKCQI